MAAALLTAGLVLVVQAGGLVSIPLARAGLIWPFHVCLLIAAVALGWRARPWRSASIVAFGLFWASLWVWMPYALRVAPDAGWASREMESLGFACLISLAALVAGVGAGPRAWRAGWLLGLALTGGIGLWELATDQHLWVTPRRPWPFHGTVAAATYINPNNFGIVLLSMLVAALAWRASTRRGWARTGLTVAAVFAAVMVLASQSRAAALGLVIVLALEARRSLRTRRVDVRGMLRRHPRWSWAVAGVGAALVVASFVVPAIAARNPVAQMVTAAMQPATGASDAFRIQLIELALGYAADSGYLGTGAGSFEPIMWNDPASGIAIEANLHNAFVELFMQYGWVVNLALVAVLVAVVRALVRSRLSGAVRPRIAVLRTETLGHLVVFVALGFTASSSLALPVWWLVLAQVCAGAPWLRPGWGPVDTPPAASAEPVAAPPPHDVGSRG